MVTFEWLLCAYAASLQAHILRLIQECDAVIKIIPGRGGGGGGGGRGGGVHCTH